MAKTKPAKVTRILCSQGLNKSKHDRLSAMAVLCGRVRADVWLRCSGVSTVQQSPYDVRDAWMAEGYAWHGLPARLGKAMLTDALGDIAAAREAAKVPVKKAIRHRTRGNRAERERLYSLLKRNRWTEDPFLHRQMRQQWRGGRSHVTNQIVADAGSYTTKVWHDRAWVYLQGLERGQRIAIPLKGTHLPSGTLRILLRDNGQVEVHYA
ncbi:MAG: transposase, partial [Caldilineaceae bacterium SB0666_bin_21]|nr:transposase [Caldilineaceae bacterium SB0666_bin_21]